jgi:hypothetical protein
MSNLRDPEGRYAVFLDFWQFHTELKAHPGGVYHLLPAIADTFQLDGRGRAWLTWLNGNTQNPATSLLLLKASGYDPKGWEYAVRLWEENRLRLQWDTDRRHQKFKFGEATERFMTEYPDAGLEKWTDTGMVGWPHMWDWALSLPHMGRLSAWSMSEYAQILLGEEAIPDASSLLLGDPSGSRSHRTGLAVVAGYQELDSDGTDHAPWWTWTETKPILLELQDVGDRAYHDGHSQFGGTRYTLESALCTYKSWHKPNRRYPNVYNDMAYDRIKRAESLWGNEFEVLWQARRDSLPEWARLEDNPRDPGLSPVKQNWYLERGETVMMGHWKPEYWSEFDDKVASGWFPLRKDKW